MARIESKFVCLVSTVTDPPAGATHEYQMDAPPELPAWLGSAGSFVAPTLFPVTLPLPPLSGCRALN